MKKSILFNLVFLVKAPINTQNLEFCGTTLKSDVANIEIVINFLNARMVKLILAVVFAVFISHSLFATTRFVKPIASGSGNGSSWANASSDIQTMVQASVAGDQVWVASGTYKPHNYPYNGNNQLSLTDTRDYSFHLKDGVKLYGGFFGNETSINQRNLALNITILSGDIGVINDNSDNCFHVIQAFHSTVIDGFTIKYGNANGSSYYFNQNLVYRNDGGGVYLGGDHSLLNNCIITENLASRYGGGINILRITSIKNTLFHQNTSSSNGGAIYLESLLSDTNKFVNNTFTNNTANLGGAFFIDRGKLKIDSSEFNNNIANDGMALYFDNNTSSASSIITNSFFHQHTAPNVNAKTIYSSGYNLTFINNRFEENTGYAVVYVNNRKGDFFNNVFSGNSACSISLTYETSNSLISGNSFVNNTVSVGLAVAIHLYSSSPTIERNFFINNHGQSTINSTSFDGVICQNVFKGNSTTGYGGAIYSDDGNSLVSGNTFIENSSLFQHGMAIAVSNSHDTIANNIFYGNILSNPNIHIVHNLNATQNQFVLINNNLEGNLQNYNTTQQIGNIFIDPNFIDETDFDGLDDVYGTSDDGLKLSMCSPLIDRGDSNFVVGTIDLYANTRIMEETVDIGAMETSYPYNYPELFTLNGQGLYCLEENGTSFILNGSEDSVTYELLLNGLSTSNPIIGNGDTLFFDSISTFGVYSIVATNSVGCQRVMSDSIEVNLYPSPVVVTQATPSTICEGLNSNLSATGALNYVWSEGLTVSPTITTTYTVIGTSIDGCTDTSSVVVNVIPFEQPVLNYDAGLLSVSGQYDTFSWLNCATTEIYSDQIDSVFIPLENGIYAVTVSMNGCSATSDCIEINDLHLLESTISQNIVFPNPVEEVLFFTLNSGLVSYSIMSMDGRVVQTGVTDNHQINLIDNITKGTYILLLNQNKENSRTMFVKE